MRVPQMRLYSPNFSARFGEVSLRTRKILVVPQMRFLVLSNLLDSYDCACLIILVRV
jgi:hypothetical protein